MPGLKEVEIYLSGLWLLIKGDRQGFGFLDLTDRGLKRSFFAIIWSLPGMVFSWVFWYRSIIDDMPDYAKAKALFFLRMAMIDLVSWMAPLLLMALICLIFGLGRAFTAMVVATNWLALPVAYANAVLIAVAVVLPDFGQVAVLLWLLLLMTMVGAVFRLMLTIVGPNILLVSTLTLTMVVPTMILTNFLEKFLDVAPL
ncbi:hypothetical protein NAC44_04015 [Allorhizobium sp. BGMRC 0089]|uniref:hypothetical protein n=1 Tax=Allorhizobium sonneratiae TaxID=2934936 RepID=UPI002033C146|nr:hypothetical protein [Allorhizobium sonneratiae]MCM2291492.1 hypothetical protein [Allorhizobium sonneratiae]